MSIRVRDDGDAFAGCDPVLRSRDGGVSWMTYSPSGATENVVFDPTKPGRAVVRGTHSYYSTEDDGATWTAHPFDSKWTGILFENVAPSQLVFDPLRPGRLLAARIDTLPSNDGFLRPWTQLYESMDLGGSWRLVSSIAPPDPSRGYCAIAELVFDHTGTLLASTFCGFFRSADRGATWQKLPGVPGAILGSLVIDKSRAGRIVAWAYVSIMESLDAGQTWTALPLPPEGPYRGSGHPPRDTIALDSSGRIWIATVDGVYEFDATSRVWLPHNDGLLGVQIFMEPSSGQPPLLLAASAGLQSPNDGASWLPWRVDSQRVLSLYRNLTTHASFLAHTEDRRLHRSSDGGRTWTFVAPAPAHIQTYGNLIPVGVQPGLVYGLSGACPDSFGCFWRDVVKSTDGGVSWSRIKTDVAGRDAVLVASPADPRRLFLGTSEGIYRTRDAGEHWDRVPAPAQAENPVADPIDPARWYATIRPNTVLMSQDFGANWTDISPSYASSLLPALLVDPRKAGRLYLIASDASVSVSGDFGGSWQTIVAGDPTRSVYLPRFDPSSSDTIYASSSRGALKLDLLGGSTPAPVRAVEYYRSVSGHYFITADINEIYQLDSHAGFQGEFVRTGQEFDVWPAGAKVSGATPVCRFYGKPEKGLDSHFYSASPAECQAVKDRFADSWILESPEVFVVILPNTVDGACPIGAKPVYRLFNNRSDANHRYTTSLAVQTQMRSVGWIPEGYGTDAVAMCTP